MGTSIAIYPPLKVEGGRLSLSYGDSAQRLRFFLTYFEDVLIVPTGLSGHPLNFMSRDEFSAVDQRLAMTLPDRPIQIGSVRAGMFDHDIEAVFQEVNRVQPGRWSVATPPCSRWNGQSEPIPHLLATFERILPCPGVGVPLEEIAQFRTANSRQLQRFTDQIDIIIDCTIAGDKISAERDLRNMIEELEIIESEMKKEGWSPLKIDFSVKRMVAATGLSAISTAIAVAAGLNPILAAALGAMAGSISIEDRSAMGTKMSNQIPRIYEYIIQSFHRFGNTSPFYTPVEFENHVDALTFANNSYVARFPREQPSEPQVRNSIIVWNSFG
ncbi:DUF6236 family protein [Sandarakinorhabdus oryzae]|uniref:DUF6236 family protein n=1 Tax=Sandarakinorhabdus oryzae TaxID=2675220 RepID=UPI0012E1337C|nr:DUF6236 family protein [Sandarakinorhabdus oryzae]